MIKQTTTVPQVESDEAPPPSTGWRTWAFVVAELVLLGSIPVLALLGFRTLLDSRAGEFAVEPGPDDPGWMALVDPTSIGSLVDVDDGRVAGVVLVVPSGDEVEGGVVILVSGSTVVDGSTLDARSPVAAVGAIERALRLTIEDPVVGDADGWAALVGEQTIELANPDPVPGDDGGILVEPGRVVVGAPLLTPLSSRRPVGVTDPEALEFRRVVLWRTLLDEVDFTLANSTEDEAVERLRAQLASIAAGVHRVETLPGSGGEIDLDAAELLVRDVVARPLGLEPGDRLQVRILDRAGNNDLTAAARNLGAAGFEVVQIGNAAVFDHGPTQVLAPPGADADAVARLAEVADAATVPPAGDAEAVATVTLLLGDRADIAIPS